MFFTPKRRPTAHRLLGRHGRDRRARREHATTLYVTGSIQVALAVALAAAGFVAFQAVQAHARDVDATTRLALPGAFVIGALVTLRSALRNLRLAKAEAARSNEGDETAR
ncbi:MAG TPA: hypothetical protein VEC56_10195 [Candidatus Krumholzibacteria bacterium]|nr:hypothetical protein [Candidatus Krumholzibacteria bacterium]